LKKHFASTHENHTKQLEEMKLNYEKLKQEKLQIESKQQTPSNAPSLQEFQELQNQIKILKQTLDFDQLPVTVESVEKTLIEKK